MTPRLHELTEHQERVLEHLADGLSVEQIAGRLGCTPRTVRAHRENARKALNAANQTQAVAILLRARARA